MFFFVCSRVRSRLARDWRASVCVYENLLLVSHPRAHTQTRSHRRNSSRQKKLTLLPEVLTHTHTHDNREGKWSRRDVKREMPPLTVRGARATRKRFAAAGRSSWTVTAAGDADATPPGPAVRTWTGQRRWEGETRRWALLHLLTSTSCVIKCFTLKLNLRVVWDSRGVLFFRIIQPQIASTTFDALYAWIGTSARAAVSN